GLATTTKAGPDLGCSSWVKQQVLAFPLPDLASGYKIRSSPVKGVLGDGDKLVSRRNACAHFQKKLLSRTAMRQELSCAGPRRQFSSARRGQVGTFFRAMLLRSGPRKVRSKRREEE